jgi:RNA polymerase sigma-70 factor (ECF subfamily)
MNLGKTPARIDEGDGHARLSALLSRIAHGDVVGFESLYAATRAALYRQALHLTRRRESAEDVLQESYMKIWRYARYYDAVRGRPMAWLSAIVRNQALDHLRLETKLEYLVEEISPDLVALEEGPEDVVDRSLQARKLASYLTCLSPPQRQAISLSFFQDHTHAEISDVMQAPEGTVKSWVRRGLLGMRRHMASESARDTAHITLSSVNEG